MAFEIKRRVAYFETDAMGVVHHSNYIRYFEEARVELLRSRGLMNLHAPYGEHVFAVVGLSNRFRRPARFDEEIVICAQTKLEGAKIFFQYAAYSCGNLANVGGNSKDELLAWGETELVPVDAKMKLARLPSELRDMFSVETWSADWPARQIANQGHNN